MWKKEATEGCRHRGRQASQVSLVETCHPHSELGTEVGHLEGRKCLFPNRQPEGDRRNRGKSAGHPARAQGTAQSQTAGIESWLHCIRAGQS